jgi:hypothetical protein
MTNSKSMPSFPRRRESSVVKSKMHFVFLLDSRLRGNDGVNRFFLRGNDGADGFSLPWNDVIVTGQFMIKIK